MSVELKLNLVAVAVAVGIVVFASLYYPPANENPQRRNAPTQIATGICEAVDTDGNPIVLNCNETSRCVFDIAPNGLLAGHCVEPAGAPALAANL